MLRGWVFPLLVDCHVFLLTHALQHTWHHKKKVRELWIRTCKAVWFLPLVFSLFFIFFFVARLMYRLRTFSFSFSGFALAGYQYPGLHGQQRLKLFF